MRFGSLRRLALAGALAVSLGAPAVAAAASPLTGVSTSTPATTTPATTSTVTTVTATSTSGSGGLTTFDIIAIGVVTIVIFATIIHVIRSDARLHTPRGRDTAMIDRERGTVTPRAERVKRSRARARAARRARRAGR